jgi:uridylate kinase
VKYDQISFADVIAKGLNIMDMTAFTLCRENNLPIVVFNINDHDNLLKIVKGHKVGTLIK